MLTGQCKNDFFSWLASENILRFTSDIDRYAYITEWFDSVDIYILTTYYKGYFHCLVNSFTTKAVTRQEATKAAIEKANELYNDKFK